MKLKTLKPHYYESIYRAKNSVYFADRVHSERAVRNNLCIELELPTREDKQHPKTKPKAIETKKAPPKKRKYTKKKK
jgi:hypothetical protein